jgi:hypothetical protein
VPRDAIWIFAPQSELTPQIAPDYQLIEATLRLDLTNSSGPILQVEFRLTVNNKTRTYGLGILQPLRVVENRATASNDLGLASKPITSMTPSGSYFTRSQFTFTSYGTPTILLSVPLYAAMTFFDFGRKGTGFTFGTGYGIRGGPEVEEFMRTSTPDVILNNGLTLSVIYPSSWQLTFPDTFPIPDKEFGVGGERAATWSLKFNSILPEYFVMVTLVWSDPAELMLRDLAIFGSGVLIAMGSGIAVEGTRGNESNDGRSNSKSPKTERNRKHQWLLSRFRNLILALSVILVLAGLLLVVSGITAWISPFYLVSDQGFVLVSMGADIALAYLVIDQLLLREERETWQSVCADTINH